MRHLLSILPKPSRYTGTEEGAVHRDPSWEKPSLRIGLAFPDLYEVGMSYLGQKILYGLVNSERSWQAERVFAPCTEAAAILREHEAPLCTLESDIPLAELDMVGFSITHELCYTNVLYMMDLAGIPLRSAERSASGGNWPVITAGGGCTLAAEPLAPFVDLMFLGEGEEILPEFLRILEKAKAEGWSREALLEEASRLEGVYVPEFFSDSGSRLPPVPLKPWHASVKRRAIPDMDKAFYPSVQPVPFGAVHNRLALEIGRGCTRGCRFCQAGIIYRPARERSVENLRELLDASLKGTGYDDVSFLSLSTGDFSALKTLFHSCLDRCAAEQIAVSLPSLRVGSIDDSIMQGVAGIKRSGATLAPEAGSQRLRDVINKGITEAELVTHVQKLFEHGWQQVKLYFMIGLPTETDEDLLAIIDLARKARDAAGPGIKRLQVTVAVSPFVPKAHTPFQWEEQISREEIRRRVGVLLSAVRQEKRIKLRWHEPEMSFLEGVFSRGDRRLAGVVESAYRKGAVFTDWIDNFSLEPWLEALRENGLDPLEFTGALEHGAPLPWEHLESGVSKEFLSRELERSKQGKVTQDCRYNACRQCGVCDTRAAPSLLGARSDGESYANRLNLPQRDQEAHSARLDGYGRVIVKPEYAQPGEGPARTEGANGKASGQGKKALPPKINPALTRKAAHFRLWYRKEEGATFLSQLELQSIFERAMRRAGLPLAFSQGFHPLPQISFARALPVGVASRCEWMCVHLREEWSAGKVFEAMRGVLPAGLNVFRVEELPVNRRPEEQAEERFRMDWAGSPERGGLFVQAWEALERAVSLPWVKPGKKGPQSDKQLDLRSFFSSFSLSPENISCIFTANWCNNYLSPLLLVRLALGLALNGNADEFAPYEFRLTKTE